MKKAFRKSSAFTLVELLVVFSIGAIVMSLGVAAYINLNRDLTWHSSVTSVTSLLQAARSSAIETRTPVSVILKTEPLPEKPSQLVCLQAYASLTNRIGTWHFEEPTEPFTADTVLEGAFSQKATPVNMEGSQLINGRVGKAIRFQRWENGAEITPQQALVLGDEPVPGEFRKIPAYDLRQGMKVSAWIKPELPPTASTDVLYYPIIAKPADDGLPVYSLTLVLEPDAQAFGLLGHARIISLERNTQGRVTTATEHTIETLSSPMIRPNIWTHVSMTYIGTDSETNTGWIAIYVNDRQVENDADGNGLLQEYRLDDATVDDPGISGQIMTSDQAAHIGSDGIDSFNGAIDEVIVDAITKSGRTTPRDTVTFKFWNVANSEGVYRIDFDRTGKLAAPGFPLIGLFSSGGRAATMIGIERSGAIKTWSLDADQAEAQATDWTQTGGN